MTSSKPGNATESELGKVSLSDQGSNSKQCEDIKRDDEKSTTKEQKEADGGKVHKNVCL
jgi:hypothetical protein